jgi:hypothetical protein
VRRWVQRFTAQGVDGLLRDATRPPGRQPLPKAVVERVVAMTLHELPPDATQWSARRLAKAAGVGHGAVQKIWAAHGLKPHLIRRFKLSTDQRFAEKLRDVVGLYIDPPERALVLSVDEKSQMQALDRTQPGLPMKRGKAGTMTHDYKRHGTTTLFAALDILSGKVIGQCMLKHRAVEFVRFLRRIDKTTPPQLDLHLVLRQLRRPQGAGGEALARRASALPPPLHPDLRLLGQCRRRLLRPAHHKATQARRVPLGHGAAPRHRRLSRAAQHRPKALRLDQTHRVRPRQGRPR